MKKIEDYLHLYLGCEVEITDGQVSDLKYFGRLEDVSLHSPQGCVVRTSTGYTEPQRICFAFKDDVVRPLLRPLDTMTEEEETAMIEEMPDIEDWEPHAIARRGAAITAGYLKRRFDLFGLIESGVAIDSTVQASVATKPNQGTKS